LTILIIIKIRSVFFWRNWL